MRFASAFALLFLALSLGAPLALPRAAGADVLWDQLSGNDYGFPSQDFEAAYDCYDCLAADDFTVPEPGWIIEMVEFDLILEHGPEAPVHGINIYIMPDRGDNLGDYYNPVYYEFAPVDTVYHGPNTVTLATPFVLEPGHYFFGVAPALDFSWYGQCWFEITTHAPVGQEFHAINPNGCFGAGSDWFQVEPGYDASFRLHGGFNDVGLPDAVIDLPADDVVISEWDFVEFAGTATDEDGEIVDWLWTFGEGSGIDDMHVEDPGLVQFNRIGVFEVTFNAQDNDGKWDPMPDKRTITVEGIAPDAVIDLPAGDVLIDSGDYVEFAGTATDENGEVVDWLWEFGEGSGLDDVHVEDPGSVQFNNPGVFTVTFNAQDNDGNWDPTPDQRTVTVNEGPWWLMNPPDPPDARGHHALAYDAESDVVILFGGYINKVERTDDTWAYDYNTDTWTELFPEVSPSARIAHAMAYDAESDRVILFGGIQDGDDKMGDTWAYDHNTNTWVEMNPPAHPDDRYGLAFAYDAESDLIVLHGGRGQPYINLDDTWWYDYNTNTWHGPFYPDPRPSPRRNLPMAYDAESDRCILYGGEDDAGHPMPGTWAYDQNTNTWDDMRPPNPPEERMLHAMAYHAGIDRVVLFGGAMVGGYLDDTWAYDYNSNTWGEIPAAMHPSSRIACENMAYDAESSQIIFFGGDEGGEAFVDDTWAFTAAPFYAPEDWLWTGWNWIALAVAPYGGDPTATLRFDCGGIFWRWDKYGKWGQVYQPPFVRFDMIVGESYLLWLDDVPEPVSYLGTLPEMPFEHKMGRMGWTWLGKPGTEELGGDDFMDTVFVKYPSDENGEVRTAREDWQSDEPWLNWGWSWWNAQVQAAQTFTPYFSENNVCCPWLGYRCWVRVGTAQSPDDTDQVTLIWPRTGG